MNAAARTGDRHGLRRWVLAALLLAVGWLVTPHAVTVYDDVGQPDEPYRYVNPPTGAKATTQKPTGARSTLPVAAGLTARGGTLSSTESGPQVSVYLPTKGLAASGPTILVSLVPQAPTVQPSDGRIDGNVYRLSITAATGPVTFTSQSRKGSISLRATTAKQPGPVVEHRSGAGQAWRPVTTYRFGNDVYVGTLPAAGEYALVFLREPASGPAGTGSSSSHRGLVVGLLLLFILLLSVILAVRWRSREGQE